jgi:hypothetical protein
MPRDYEYGTSKGRLTYRTEAEAEAVADDLGVDGVHAHELGDDEVYMPGAEHSELNDSLTAMGLPPTGVPSSSDTSDAPRDAPVAEDPAGLPGFGEPSETRDSPY